MSLATSRKDLQALATAKLEDASLLFKNKRFSNAYYLAGYSVEIALKACASRLIVHEAIPDKDFVKAIYQHNLRNLVGVAGLSQQLKDRERADTAFATNWALVCEWSPECRYETRDPISSQILLEAVAHENAGVFQWIKVYW